MRVQTLSSDLRNTNGFQEKILPANAAWFYGLRSYLSRVGPRKLVCLLLAAAFLLTWPAAAAAKPDKPVIQGNTATFNGNQSLGILGLDWNRGDQDFIINNPVTNVVINNINEVKNCPNSFLATDRQASSGNSGKNNYNPAYAQGGDGQSGYGAVPLGITTGNELKPNMEISTNRKWIILQLNQAGNGGNGGEGVAATGYGKGGRGGDGSSAGGLNVDFGGGKVAKLTGGIWLRAIGGTGGRGGYGYGTGYGRGGNGGNGGSGGPITFALEGLKSYSGITDLISWGGGIVAESRGGNAGAAGAGGGIYGEGGHGGSGGSGGIVSVKVSNCNIQGDSNDGISARSLAGNGGDGGNAGGAGGTADHAGPGGWGGDVSVETSSTAITTTGNNACGYRLLSWGAPGGGGGAGGGASGIGARGGEGGSGRSLTLQCNDSIFTSGSNSTAVEARSIGNVGGSGGAGGGAYGAGGAGGHGGSGGTVSITCQPKNQQGLQIITKGDSASGIWAQSRGDYGGKGANSGGAAAFSSNGGNGGHGGQVTVTNGFYIITQGKNAHGIYAESCGGAGGNGGNAGSALGSRGGDGGEGGAAAGVTATNNHYIKVTGSQSQGIWATSEGGAGGSGGSGVGAYGKAGAAKGGGSGGDVKVTNNGIIDTGNVDTEIAVSRGIMAQSIGGYSRKGGQAYGVVAYGGDSNSGGSGGSVTAINNSLIRTWGTDSGAIVAQSVGGGGGSAGSGGSLQNTLGGNGAGGGNGGQVTVANKGDIYAAGERSGGILAQSLGGGGGDAGGAFTVLQVFGAVCIGGQTGPGGSGGKVEVKSSRGEIRTLSGAWSPGIVAQSLGGGGGKGGWSLGAGAGPSSGTFSLGGSGGSGGKGGEVVVDAGATKIWTGSNDSQGVLAQSLGGGGGMGGWSLAAGGSSSVSASISLGGSGGDGGNGQKVEIATGNVIQTLGGNSKGIEAQSIGGGGGDAGWSLSGAAGYYNVSAAIGGSGGGGGSGGQVVVNKGGDIQTSGPSASGILAQSTGGGGGNGGFAVTASGGLLNGSLSLGGKGGGGGSGNAVTVRETSTGGHQTTTKGVNSPGILAQSTGGGGGNGGFAVSGSGGVAGVSVALGASGGSGGGGGSATVANTGGIATSGDLSSGILAQSTGGGGGRGGFSVAASASGVPPGGGGGSLTVSVGGQGGAGSQGGNVNLTQLGTVATSGNLSAGLEALSTGGGGGNGGFSIAASANVSLPSSPNASIGVSLGGSGGNSSAGGNIVLTGGGTQPSITTKGDTSPGILAVSSGGGGGNGGFSVAGAVTMNPQGKGGSVAVSLGGKGGTGGQGGSVQVKLQPAQDDEIYIIDTKGDNSDGVRALSLGGGGGNGGFSIGASGSVAANSATASLSLGGSGGGGGDGSSVAFSGQLYEVSTAGKNSCGIVAAGIGGGGGNGGFSVAGSLSLAPLANLPSTSLAVSLGGQGANGGKGGWINLDGSGSVLTMGDNAIGILAQSVGGGGGNGGFSVSGALNASGGPSFAGIAASVSLGGSGGQGGEGRTVACHTGGSVVTMGQNATAILAQSVGGGGGNGDFSVGAGGSLTNVSTVNLGLGASVGGSGGDGGSAGQVTLSKYLGSIATAGSNSRGILAQSVGGGGGNGDFSIAGTLSFVTTATASGSAALSLGGQSGKGGKGGEVALTALGLTDTIRTLGVQSEALLAQSIGGGGGNGGFSIAAGASVSGYASSTVSLGGSGGTGGSGGAVRLGNETSLDTVGDRSTAILAQSVGGGGGNGGFSISGAANFKAPGKFSLGAAVSLGGKGGAGNTAGAVTVANAGQISTQGNSAKGISAQSVGGGGGNGGFSGTFALNVAPQDKFLTETDSISLGGTGGTGGAAGAVQVSSVGNISTQGDFSDGIQAQSIGGGGGNGNISAAILWTGAEKIKFDEIKLTNVSLSIGGSGGTGGDGGTVTVDTTKTKVDGAEYANSGSTISTAGDSSDGIFAQSVGGGGGVGSYRFTLTNVNTNAFSIVTEKAYKLIDLGCKGGEGGKGSVVTITDNSRSIQTQGDQAAGIFAQSVGGGGGKSGFGFKVGVSWDYKGQGSFLGNTGISLGGSGASGSNGGRAEAVTVTEVLPARGIKTIQTEGEASDGIFAQSVGGGGGNAGITVKGSVNSGFSVPDNPMNMSLGGNGADGGAVTVTAVSNITTKGDSSYGISAQSVGGGGGYGSLFVGLNWTTRAKAGWYPFAGINSSMGGKGGTGGNGREVSVKSSGNISTLGNSAAAIFAQSVGGGGGDGGGSISVSGYNPQPGQNADKVSSSISRGGEGGKGGEGSYVAVDNRGAISTGCADEIGFLAGNYAYGIFAQSIGGGGGSGGFSIAFSEQNGYGSLSASFGGSGGSGGTAGGVNVFNYGAIRTLGDGATGIYAHSQGGGGGSGGFSISAGISAGQSLSLSLGGKGGDGGKAGRVTVYNAGSIQTGYQDPPLDGGAPLIHGHDSPGLYASSIGGGGGNGGFSIGGNVSFGKATGVTASANVSVGGSGGQGGTGGTVDITNYLQTGDFIKTLGDRSPGIAGLSQGGGGGNGGYSIAGSLQFNNPKDVKGISASVSVGGSGGSGGTAGAVTVVNSEAGNGSIQTRGFSSPGIRAQSIAGGGGNGGFSVAGGLRLGPAAAGVAVGGKGGSGNTAGTVSIRDGGESIATGGDLAPGIMAQSIGGGGGTGGFGIGGAIALDPFISSFASVVAGTGGEGGTGGDGNTVAITNSSRLATLGLNSPGILAQSIGAGGGTNGFSVRGEILSQITEQISVGSTKAASGKGQDVTIDSLAPTITTQGTNSSGIIGQSIGAGGGASWVTVNDVKQVNVSDSSYKLGGQGGSSGDGGTVKIYSRRSLEGESRHSMTITGSGACGLVAQSIGGGGGILGNNAATKSLEIGGTKATQGKGGEVTIFNDSYIQTSAQGSYGIVAQSLGGGGGLALYSGTDVISAIKATMRSGDKSNSGDGGKVEIANHGSIATTGTGAIGLVAQSLGGGGGLNVLTGEAGSAGGSGSGGEIIAANYGSIATKGASAHGMFAQSSGGTGSGGNITVANYKEISVSGAGARPIYAVNNGQAGPGSINVYNRGTLSGAADGTAPILLVGGSGNTLYNYGQITSAGEPVAGRYTSFTQAGLLTANSLSLDDSFYQTGDSSTTRLNELHVGQTATGHGFYTLSSGTLNVANEHVGRTGSGNFNQTSGTHTVTGSATLGSSNASNGYYNLSGGSFSTPALSILYGQFQQNGGSLQVANTLNVGPSQASSAPTYWGGYQITGGTVEVPTINIMTGGMLTWAGGTARYQEVNLEGGILCGVDVSGSIRNSLLSGLPRLTIHSGTLTAGSSTWTINQETVILDGNVTLGASPESPKITIAGSPVSLNGDATGVSRTLTVNNTTEIQAAVVNGGPAAGASGITKQGTGTLILSGKNLYTGPTAVNAGILELAGTGTLLSPVENNPGGTLALSSTAAAPFAGGVTWNGGSLALGPDITFDVGPSPFVVAAQASLDTAAGSVLNAPGGVTGLGLITINGTLNTDLSNTARSMLTGGGVINGNTLNLGTVNPGNSPGTLTFVGSYRQSAGSIEIVEVESQINYDRIVVTGDPGTVSLDGAIAPTLYGGFKPRGNQVFPGVVTATGGVTGNFATITNQQFTPTLSWQTRYNPASVDIWVQRHYTGANLGLSANQRAVGAMLNSLAGVTGGDLDEVLNTIDYLGVAGVQDALQEISPEKSVALSNLAFTGASFQMRNQAQRLTDLRFADRAAALGGGGLAGINPFGSSQFGGLLLAFNSPSMVGLITQQQPLESQAPWGVYFYPNVVIGNQKSTANQTGYNYTMAGFTLGADYRIQDNLIVGLATGYSYTNANYYGSGGGVQNTTWPLTVYGAYLGQSFYAYGSLGYVMNLFNQQRGIQFNGLKRTADSSTTGNQLNVYAEAGYDLKAKPFIVTPVISLAYSGLWLNGYSETGAGALNLDVASQNADSLQTGVGLKIAAPCRLGGTRLVPQVYATYQHEFANNSRGLNANLSQGGSTFSFNTDAPQRDFAVVGAKVDLFTSKNLQLSLNYNAEVGRSNSLAQSIYTGLRWQF